MEYHVSSLSIALMGIGAAAGFIVPIGLVLLLRKKTGASVRSFFIGWLAFFLSVLVLERLFHSLVLKTPVGTAISGNLFSYALYGGVTAGLFEELARYFAFKKFLVRELEDDSNALMYGAGHGGCELFNIYSITMLNNIILSLTLNSSGISALTQSLSSEQASQVIAQIPQLCAFGPGTLALGLLERASAMIVHISLSVLVFCAVKKPEQNRRLLLIAVELHALTDFLAVILSGLLPIWAAEAGIAAFALFVAWFARKVWKDNHQE